jgi:hypothetical protein
MRAVKLVISLLCLIAVLVGCDQQAMFERFLPKAEEAMAKQVLAQLAAKDYAALEKQLDASIRTPTIRSDLERLAALLPRETPKSERTVGWQAHTVDGLTTYSFTFEYQYASTWLLTNVVLQRRNGAATIIGLHANPVSQSLADLNRFTFEGKGLIHYVVFTLVVAVPLFVLYALVLCFRTPMLRRKWLWLLFVALGLGQFSFNWTDGSYGIGLLNFALLGGGFFRAGPYAPIILSVSIPIGAIVFMMKRRALAARNAD